MAKKNQSEQKQSGNKSGQKAGFLHVLFAWVLVVLWAGFIFYMSSRTSSNLSTGFFASFSDWLKALINSVIGYHEDPVSVACHFIEYTVLGFLLSHALGLRLGFWKSLLFAIVVASAYGVSDEIHQIFVPGRMCDPADWAVDTLGASLGALISAFVFRKRR